MLQLPNHCKKTLNNETLSLLHLLDDFSYIKLTISTRNLVGMYIKYMRYDTFKIKPEPIMLLDLPIIPSRISHNFYPFFLFYSHAITYYSCIIL